MFDNLTARLTSALGAVSGRRRLTEGNIASALSDVRVALLEADVALPVVRDFTREVRLPLTNL